MIKIDIFKVGQSGRNLAEYKVPYNTIELGLFYHMCQLQRVHEFSWVEDEPLSATKINSSPWSYFINPSSFGQNTHFSFQ